MALACNTTRMRIPLPNRSITVPSPFPKFGGGVPHSMLPLPSFTKSNARKCCVANANLHMQTVQTPTSTVWSEFAANISGEWDGFGADFTSSGTPIELPESVVPQAFRDWEVQVFDWQTQCPTLAQPDPPQLSLKTIQLLPTVGCEADAATQYSILERNVGGVHNLVSAFAYQSTGSYVALWPAEDKDQQFEIEYCFLNPKDRESRVRIILLLASHNRNLTLKRIRVFAEQWYGPFRNGEQLGGCAIRDSAFAAGPPLKAAQVGGTWQGPRAMATFGASQSEILKELLEDSIRKTVRDECNLTLLPKQLWCSVKGSKDGETSCEVGWMYDHGSAVTSACIFSVDGKLKEISIARETATLEEGV